MRIGIVSHNYQPHLGGLEAIVHGLTRELARRHDVTAVSTAWQGRTGISTEDGATVHRLPAWHGAERRGVPYPLPLGPGVLRAHAALRSCEVLHVHGSLYATTLLALSARRRGVPLILTEHVGFVRYPSRVLNAVQRVAWALIGGPVVSRAAVVIAYNTRVHKWLAARFGEQKVVFIPNGVDTEKFKPVSSADQHAARVRLGLPTNGVLALFVGRAADKKNLDAVLRLPSEAFRLVVCGAERSLPAEVLDLGVLPHDAMPEVFASADFLLHAATGEGFPVAIQEAMASGLPVVLLWDSGYSGSVDREVVVAVDTLGDLAAATANVAINSELRRRHATASREYAVRHWAWETSVQRHDDVFRAATKEDT